MITIAHCKRFSPANKAVYVGRPTPLGNPYQIGKDGTRDEVIQKYRDWLVEQINGRNPEVLGELSKLKNFAAKADLTLTCWCHPAPCRASVVKAAIEHVLAREQG